jgi:hypothetical protein
MLQLRANPQPRTTTPKICTALSFRFLTIGSRPHNTLRSGPSAFGKWLSAAGGKRSGWVGAPLFRFRVQARERCDDGDKQHDPEADAEDDQEQFAHLSDAMVLRR